MSSDEKKRNRNQDNQDPEARKRSADGTDASEPDAGSESGPDESSVDFTRRALIRAGWTVPVIMAVGLPNEASAQSPAPHNDGPHVDHVDHVDHDEPMHFDEPDHAGTLEAISVSRDNRFFRGAI